MNSISAQDIDTGNGALIYARIYAPEVIDITPLREFLVSFNCRIFINNISPTNCQYTFILGSHKFVKKILARITIQKDKVLIISDQEYYINPKILEDRNLKIIVLDFSLLPELIPEIFRFFIGQKNYYLTLRHKATAHGKDQSIAEYENIDGQPELLNAETGHTLTRNENAKKFRFTSLPVIYPEISGIDREPSVYQNDKNRIASLITDIYRKSEDTGTTARLKKPLHGRIFKIMLLVIVPLLIYISVFFATGLSLLFSYRSLYRGNLIASKAGQNVSRILVNQLKTVEGTVTLPARLIPSFRFLNNNTRLVYSMDYLTRSHAIALELAESGLRLSHKINIGNPGSTIADRETEDFINTVGGKSQEIMSLLGLAKSEIKGLFALDDGILARVLTPIKVEALAKLSQNQHELATMVNLLNIYTRNSGYNQPKTFLVLFQNSLELRPGGGFIGSIGEVKMENGFVSDYDIQDVYVLDGQLRGHVDPPKPISKFMKQEHWYLRDSNWAIDFNDNAQRALWFYEKETGKKLDGVVAVNSPFILNLLQITGPIVLADYNDTVTADNFLGKSIYYVESNFFPGSTAKKDFLSSLASSLLLHLSEMDKGKFMSLYREVAASVEKHDLMFYFPNTDFQKILSHNNFAGPYPVRFSCQGISCVTGYFGVVEANMSVNKINYFINQKRHLELDIDIDRIRGFSTMEFNNLADDKPKSGGEYFNYMRLVMPEGSKVKSLSLDGNMVMESDHNNRETIEVPQWGREEASGSGNLVYAAFKVRSKTINTIRADFEQYYNSPLQGSKFVFSYVIPKQPGLINTTQSVKIRYPRGWTGKSLSGPMVGALEKADSFEYNTDLARDININLELIKL